MRSGGIDVNVRAQWGGSTNSWLQHS